MIYPDECKLTERIIFDSHAHLDDSKFDEVRENLIIDFEKYGVEGIITCGCDGPSSLSALSLSEKYDFIYAAVGIHPENLDSNTDIEEIKELAKHKKCVAIGEIGLDYYWTKDNKEKQLEFFEKQIILAKQLNLPIIVHDRDAHFDTLNLLLKHKPKGVVHCFSGSKEMAKEILDIGMYIGIGGVVTFNNAKKMPEIVKTIPDERLLLETDSPYLSPAPYRGEICHSGLIPITAAKIAEIKGTTAEKILIKTSNNAKKLFLK